MQNSPLAGKRILLTRAAQQVAETAALIEKKSATAISLPCLEHHILKASIQQGLSDIESYSDIVFTSVNSIQAVFENNSTSTTDFFQGKRIAVVGKKTAEALKKHHLHAEIISKTASQQGLIAAYQAQGLPQSLLFFRAESGSNILLEYLQDKGVKTQLITAYRSICPKNKANAEVLAMLKENIIDATLLGSSRTAKHYLQRIGDLELANRPILVAISQQVADAADKLGLKVQLIANDANFPSMLEVLADYFSQRSN